MMGMLVENMKINISGMEIEVSKGTPLLEIAKLFKKEGKKPIVALVNDIVCELTHIPNENDNIEFLDSRRFLR